MGLKWTDSLDIAIELDDAHPDVDPVHVNFVELRDWVLALDAFDDVPEHSGEFSGNRDRISLQLSNRSLCPDPLCRRVSCPGVAP
jgi:FeS assembly protein IscX